MDKEKKRFVSSNTGKQHHGGLNVIGAIIFKLDDEKVRPIQ